MASAESRPLGSGRGCTPATTGLPTTTGLGRGWCIPVRLDREPIPAAEPQRSSRHADRGSVVGRRDAQPGGGGGPGGAIDCPLHVPHQQPSIPIVAKARGRLGVWHLHNGDGDCMPDASRRPVHLYRSDDSRVRSGARDATRAHWGTPEHPSDHSAGVPSHHGDRFSDVPDHRD